MMGNVVSVTKQMRTETGHRLVDYDGKCAHLHGHSYLWEVAAENVNGGLDDKGMVVDFKDLKAAMKAVLDPLDHCMVLHKYKDPIIKLAGELQDSSLDGVVFDNVSSSVEKILASSNGEIPRVLLVPFNPTAENLVDYVAKQLMAHMPTFIKITKVAVWETSTSCAVWTRGGS